MQAPSLSKVIGPENEMQHDSAVALPSEIWTPVYSTAETFVNSSFRRLSYDVIGNIFGYLVDGLCSPNANADPFVCRTFQLIMSDLRWTGYGHDQGTVSLSSRSPIVGLLAPRLGRHLRELKVTLNADNANEDVQAFQHRLVHGQDLLVALPGLRRLHFRSSSVDEVVAGSTDDNFEGEVPRPSQQFLLDNLRSGLCSANMTLVLEQCPVPEDLPEGLQAIEIRQGGDPASNFNFARLQSSGIVSLHMQPVDVTSTPGMWDEYGAVDPVKRTISSGMRSELLELLPRSLRRLELSSEFAVNFDTPWPLSLQELFLDTPDWKTPGFAAGCSLSLCNRMIKLVIKVTHHKEPASFHLDGLPETLEHLELLDRAGVPLAENFPSRLKTLVIDVSAATSVRRVPYEGPEATVEDVPGFLQGMGALGNFLAGTSSGSMMSLMNQMYESSSFETDFTAFALDLSTLPRTLERLVLVLKLRLDSGNDDEDDDDDDDDEPTLESQLPQFRGQSTNLIDLIDVQVLVSCALSSYAEHRLLERVRGNFSPNVRVELGLVEQD